MPKNVAASCAIARGTRYVGGKGGNMGAVATLARDACNELPAGQFVLTKSVWQLHRVPLDPALLDQRFRIPRRDKAMYLRVSDEGLR
jgi:hypothetical protein